MADDDDAPPNMERTMATVATTMGDAMAARAKSEKDKTPTVAAFKECMVEQKRMVELAVASGCLGDAAGEAQLAASAQAHVARGTAKSK